MMIEYDMMRNSSCGGGGGEERIGGDACANVVKKTFWKRLHHTVGKLEV